MRIFIVIAAHNRKDYTLECLRLLSNQTLNDFEVVLVDDGSTDGTYADVQSEYPQVHVIRGTGNWWWTHSMNEGFKYAVRNNADIVITLNNDTQFESDLVQQLVGMHNQFPQALIGCINTVKKGEEYIFFSGVKHIVWWKAKEYKYHSSFQKYDSGLTGNHPSMCLNGRGTLIPVSVFKKIGYFDETHFPQYASDYDFSLRTLKAGFQVLISWDIKIQSILETTGEGRTFMPQSWRNFLGSFNNQYAASSWRLWWYYYRKHAGWQAIFGLPLQYFKLCYSFSRKNKRMEGLK